jgi:hypothetical protein
MRVIFMQALTYLVHLLPKDYPHMLRATHGVAHQGREMHPVSQGIFDTPISLLAKSSH